jgi:hypothetical protein
MNNKKLQAPSSRLQRNFKHQAPSIGAVSFGDWSFSGAWSLELGAWSFPPGLEL